MSGIFTPEWPVTQSYKNYLSLLSSMSRVFNLDSKALSKLAISHFVRSISINPSFGPTAVVDIYTLYHIARVYDNLSDPALYKVIFLTAFHACQMWLHIVPAGLTTSLRQISFSPPGAYLIILQNPAQ